MLEDDVDFLKSFSVYIQGGGFGSKRVRIVSVSGLCQIWKFPVGSRTGPIQNLLIQKLSLITCSTQTGSQLHQDLSQNGPVSKLTTLSQILSFSRNLIPRGASYIFTRNIKRNVIRSLESRIFLGIAQMVQCFHIYQSLTDLLSPCRSGLMGHKSVSTFLYEEPVLCFISSSGSSKVVWYCQRPSKHLNINRTRV